MAGRRSLIRGYYFITDSGLSKHGNESDVKAAARAGVTVFQYRNKAAGTREMVGEARRLRALCPGALFLVNDRVDVALACGADGVHIGQDDMAYSDARRLMGKDAIIGVTARSVEEAVQAEKDGADYVGVSPIYSTATKPDAGKPAGVELVADVRRAVKIPIAAIGGITLENARPVIEAGADAICAISAVVAGGDAEGQMRKFLALFV